MGRLATTNTAEVIDINEIDNRTNELQVNAHNNAVEVMNRFGDGQEYNKQYFIDKARSHYHRSAEEALLTGNALIVLRQNCDHGEWQEVLESVGIHERSARRVMNLSYRLYDKNVSKALMNATNAKAKIFELLLLDDSEIKELANGADIAGITLDEVDKMSVAELRSAIRDHKAEKQAHDTLLQEKNAKLDKLAAENEKLKAKPKAELELIKPDFVLADLKAQLLTEGTKAESAILSMEKLSEQLLEKDESLRQFILETTREVHIKLQALSLNANIDFNTANGQPEWVAAAIAKQSEE